MDRATLEAIAIGAAFTLTMTAMTVLVLAYAGFAWSVVMMVLGYQVGEMAGSKLAEWQNRRGVL